MKNSSLIILLALSGFIACNPPGNDSKPDEPGKPDSLTAEQLLDSVQYHTFQYFWDGAEPVSGMARERYHVDGVYPQNDKNVVTSGGSGFGIMAILVGIERGFISREEGLRRFEKIAGFLENADSFHGVFPHWWNGETGKVKSFSSKDDGGDLVETAFLMQGLLCVRQYFANGNEEEKALSGRMDRLWKNVEWDWHTKGGEDVLYWHWSPSHGWEMNFPIEGYNECMITYILAASSPTHGVPAETYHDGWARSGGINTDVTTYGHHLSLKHNGAEKYGGPLFWAHYSYLGLDPRNLEDRYANYWEENRNHVLINYEYCVDNPKNFAGYGGQCWGLTASYSVEGYAGHSPSRDLGVISPTAALSSFPYTPEKSMAALEHFYYNLGDKIWGKYGFYDAFSQSEDWYPQRYLAIDQGPVVVMIENHRSGLLWELFMSCPEIKQGLKKLGFSGF